ncbi:hypothetical protein BJY52DRAFT_1225780 [Lactarius psammicola]|nr:hypothetical protein BJY52DRAFT_1225780 [Lactarius psammicola]
MLSSQILGIIYPTHSNNCHGHLGVNLSTFSRGAHGATLTEKDIAFTRIGSIVSSGRGFSIPASSDRIGIGSAYSLKYSRFEVLCDVLITVGMVYYLLSNRTQFRRTNTVLNLLAAYAVNCGTLHLVFTICCVTMLAKYGDTLIYVPFFFVMIRLSLCAFMSILNSRDNLRETLEGPGGIVSTLTQLNVHAGTAVPWGAQDTREASTNATVLESLPPASVSFDTSFSDSVIALDRKRHPVPPVA